MGSRFLLLYTYTPKPNEAVDQLAAGSRIRCVEEKARIGAEWFDEMLRSEG